MRNEGTGGLASGLGGWCALRTEDEMAGKTSSETLIGKLHLTEDKLAELEVMLKHHPDMTQLLVELSFQFGRNFDHFKQLQNEGLRKPNDPKKLN